MIRIPEFDTLNKQRLAILQILREREFDLGEMSRLAGLSRNACYYNLHALKENSFVSDKDALKKTVWAKAKNKNKRVKRWVLTGNGEKALEYFGGGLR